MFDLKYIAGMRSPHFRGFPEELSSTHHERAYSNPPKCALKYFKAAALPFSTVALPIFTLSSSV